MGAWLWPAIRLARAWHSSCVNSAAFIPGVMRSCAIGTRIGAAFGKVNSDKRGKIHGTGTITSMARYRGQCMAIGGRDFRRPAKHSRVGGSLRRRRQEEMGDQLRLHVNLRLCLGLGRLDSIRLQHGFRPAMVPVPRHAWPGGFGRVHHRSGDNSRGSLGHAAPRLPDGDPGVLPIRVRRDHGDHPRPARCSAA